MTTTTAPRTELHTERVPDKYGRRTVQYDRIHIDGAGRWVGRDRDLAVIVTLPKAYAAEYGDRYLVNVRPTAAEKAAGQYQGTVTYWRNRKAATDHIVGVLAGQV